MDQLRPHLTSAAGTPGTAGGADAADRARGGPTSPETAGGTEQAGGTEELDRLLDAAAVRAVQETGAYGATIFLPARDHRSLVLAMVAGVPRSLLSAWRRIPVSGPFPAAAAFRSGRTVYLSDAGETMRRFPQVSVGMPYSFASAFTPVRAGQDTLGVLGVLWPAARRGGLPSAQRRHLRATARRLGSALAALAGRGQPLDRHSEPATAQLPPRPLAPMRVGLFDWNVATGAFAADHELCAIFGIDPGDFDGQAATLAARVVPGDLEEFWGAARAAGETGRAVARRFHVLAPDGTRRPLELWGRIPGAGAEARAHLVGAVVDLWAGTAAAEAVERLRDGVFSLDPDGCFSYANRNLGQLLGIDLEDALGRPPWDVLPWLSDPAYEDRYRAAMLSQQPTSFLARRPPDQWLAFSLYPDPQGVTGRVVPVRTPRTAEEPAGERAAAGSEGYAGGDEDGGGAAFTDSLTAAPRAAPARLGSMYHVLQLASALTEAVTVREVCEVVSDQILPAFGGQELAIYVVRQKRMYLASQTGYPDGFLDRFEGITLQARLPGVEALTSGIPIFFESELDLSTAYPGIPLDQMRSWAFLPLIASGRPVGSCILGFDETHFFTNEERSVLTALGGLIAQAIERARLYDAEYALARGLQHALLPHRLPAVRHMDIAARYLPGTQGMEIGGDWYDVIDTNGSIALVIGDVEGHSVAAAATMGQLRSAVRAFATGGHEPEEVVRCTNQLLTDLDPGLLATCCYLQLEPESGEACMVRAGHPPPLLRHPGGRAEVLDLAGGAPLGVDRASDYPVTRLQLSPGSVLALYTDGLVEEAGGDIGQGIDRLRSSLAHARADTLDQLADRLLGDARRSTERADDIALLLTAYTPDGRPAAAPPHPRGHVDR